MKLSTKSKLASKAKVTSLKLARIAVIVAPIATIVYTNLDKYVGTVPETVVPQTIRLTAGGIAAVTVAVVAAVGNTKIKFSWILMGILFGILWAIQPIIEDLVLFTGIMFAGTTFNHLFIDGAIDNATIYGNMKTQGYMTQEAADEVEMKNLKVAAKLAKKEAKKAARQKMRAEAKAFKETRYRP